MIKLNLKSSINVERKKKTRVLLEMSLLDKLKPTLKNMFKLWKYDFLINELDLTKLIDL